MNMQSTLVPLLAGVLALSGLSAASAQEAGGRHEAWLDDYLAAELAYDEEQIDQFKANVAPLPRSEMIALVEKLKFVRGGAAEVEQERLSSHRRNLQRIRTAESLARARPARVAPRYVDGFFSDAAPRPRVQPVHRTGLFRGYFGWIRIP